MLGEVKRPLAVWLFLILYSTLYIGVRRLFGIFTTPNLVSLLVESAEVYGVILVSLVVFVVVWEKRRSLKDIAFSLGFKRQGTVGSIAWSFALFPILVVIGLISMMLASFLGPAASLNVAVSSNG